MRLAFATAILSIVGFGCAAPLAVAVDSTDPKPAPIQVASGATPFDNIEEGATSKSWVGAAGLSEMVMEGTSETMLGVWVDVPSKSSQTAPNSAVALVVDTSGSMKGNKIQHARQAAGQVIQKLNVTDMASLYSFSDDVTELVALTSLSLPTRTRFLAEIERLTPTGSTNLFEGIRSGERSVFSAPATYSVRRVIVISDGQANVGPTSPEVLGALATRGSEQGIQVTAVGVGLDYDERTLNALAINSSGRLYHMTESSELAGILDQEMGLIRSTAATDASIEIVPAPGVEILGIEKTRYNRESGSVKIPLGSMFSGQHREMLVRVRVSTPTQGTHPLASVRLHFRDPSDGNIDRVQETVARYQVTKNRDEIAKNENARTKDILTVVEAGKLADAAAVKAEQGDIEKAAQELAQAEQKLLAQAAAVKDDAAKKRIVANAANITKARKAADAAVAAPAAAKPAAARAVKLETNQAGMRNAGF